MDSKLHTENFNNDFLIIRSEDSGLLAKTGKSIVESKLDFIDEVIVAASEICVQLNHRFEGSRLAELNNLNIVDSSNHSVYKLPILFNDHEDWLAIEQITGLSKVSVISKLLASKLNVAMFGFLPGFVYLDGLDPVLHLPRKSIPSKYVKANSVAMGSKYLGVYSIDSPGGWYVVGRIPISILNLDALPPIELGIGDEVRLESVTQDVYEVIVKEGISFKEYNT